MFSNEKWFGASAGFYPFEIDQSIRITNNGYLNMSTNGFANAPTLTTKGTLSFWIKVLDNDDRNYVFMNYSANNNNGLMYIQVGSANDGYLTIPQYGRVPYLNGIIQRDFSNFYHFVVSFDSTSSTASERLMKIYQNGTQVTTGTFNAINQNDVFPFTAQGSTNGGFTIGRHATVGYYTECILAEINLIDGQSLDASYFGEFKNGTWIPKEYTGTYGNNGCRFTFASSDFNTSGSSISDPNGSSVDLFNNGISDASGNGNHLNLNSVSTHDILLDSPTNNFATYNILTGHSATTISEGNLRALANNSSNYLESQSSTIGVTSGKWYAEFRADDLVNDSQDNGTQIGVTTVPFNRGSGNQNGYVVGNTRVNLDQNTGPYLGVDQDLTQNNIGTYADGDIIGVALDVDNSQVSFYKNGSAITNATNASINVQNDLHFFEIQVRKYAGDTSQITANFGQDSTFSGAVSAGGNTDANGRGDFKYSVPTGYLALCSANLPDTTLSPNKAEQADDHFDTIIYDGSASNQTVTTNFQADWLWFKERTTTGIQPQMFDSSRPHSTTGTKLQSRLEPHQNLAETDSVAIQSQSGNNITLLGGVSTTNDASSRTYTMWHWKANGGTTTSDSTGSLTVARQTNATAEFSIITGTTSNVEANDMTETFGHGLSGTPDFLIIKGRSHTDSWSIWTSAIPITDVQGLQFNSTNGLFTNSSYRTVQATSTLVKIGRQAIENNGRTFVCYAFKAVEGYSRFGTYESNNSSDGTFVYTGFRPAFLITKDVDRNSMSWIIYDNKRDTSNEMNNNFNIGTSSEPYHSTGSSIDFLSNGFKFRDGSSSWNNYSTETYIYMAFAEQPFKFSNAR